MTTPTMQTPISLRTVGFLIGIMLFFVVTLLASFFLMILFINNEKISPSDGPYYFMAGLIPPSAASVLLYVKVFKRWLVPKPAA